MVFKKYYQEIVLGVILVMVLALFGVIYYLHYIKEDNNDIKVIETQNVVVENEPEEIIEETKSYVEVKGAVASPGVYAAVEGLTIINDVITLAGGFTSDAYTKNINLSKVVSNEMVIYVYTQYEYSKLNEPDIIYIEKECNCPSYDISSCINEGNSIIENGPDNQEKNENNESSLININTASIEMLTTLNGIGESKAQSIIDYRNKNGNFTKIEDITLVSGISEATFEKIKDKITI